MPEPEGDIRETLDRLPGILARRRWLILLTASGVALATIAVLQIIPNRYTSTAALVVVQQQVPQRYVVPNSTTDPNSALEAMKQEVLSRTRLIDLIRDFGLYPAQRAKLVPEQLVARMLKDIEIEPFGNPQQRDFDGFKISFTAEDPVLAQRVTSTLTSLFINENLRTREQQSSNTTNFLHEQLVAKRQKLDEQERQLRDFKLQHIGELPEQQQGNLGILTGLQTQLQNTMTGLNRAQQQRVYLQSLVNAYRRQSPPSIDSTIGSPPVGGSTNRPARPLEMAQSELARLEGSRTVLLGKYTNDHPDVQKVRREIARVEETIKRLKVSTAAAPADEREGGSAVDTRPQMASVADDDDPAVGQFKSQMEANRVEIENFLKDERKVKALIAQYENRLNQTPIREQQQGGIIRETEALRQEYADLQKKEQESQLATNLEKQQGGQQFRLIDAASSPLVPSSPKRMKISLLGLLGGIVLGLALAFLREMTNTTFYSDRELTQRIAPPLVVAIPVIPTRNEARQRRRVAIAQWAAASALTLVVLAAELYVFKRG